MPYKTIVVQVDSSRRSPERIRVACALAERHGAHLVGAAATGISRFVFPGGWAGDGAGYTEFLVAQLDVLRQQTSQAIAAFEDTARVQSLRSFEGLVLDEEAGMALSQRGRYSDLVILGQTEPDTAALATPPDLPQYVTLNCGQPVLLLPYAGTIGEFGRHPLVAWDGSVYAMRAVQGAMPFLQAAGQVDVAIFTGEKVDLHGDQPGDDLALYLARHGIEVNVVRSSQRLDNGDPLLDLVADRSADLLVMGCYGHSRMRELAMGGVTRTILHAAPMPVLMAH